MEKLVSQLTDDDRIRYKWIDVTNMRDRERRFLQGGEHTPEEQDEIRRRLEASKPPAQIPSEST